jgi:hypothetical protein
VPEREPSAETEALQRPAASPASDNARLTALPHAIGNAAMGRLLRSAAGPDVVRRMLARDYEYGGMAKAVTATADASLGINDRPASARFWNAYKTVSYAVYHGEDMRDEVWKVVGGSVGRSFLGGNTCATRVSWAFNNCGWPVRTLATPDGMRKVKFFYNDPKVSLEGKAGDGKWYIVGAPDMEGYLTLRWGRRDAYCRTNADVEAFEATLAPGQMAIFAGAEHTGAIMGRDVAAGFSYRDAYVMTDPHVVPVSIWKLPE